MLPVFVLIALPGCQSLGYYSQAIKGQCDIYFGQRAIKGMLVDPQVPADLKEKLGLVLQVRDYAERELKLKPNGHYLKYADLHRRFVVWNVNAAPEFSLEPKRWWYPVVGRLKYRGYFAETKARKYSAALEKDGYDVFVGGVEAYSTLGWFRDPVLNTFVHNSDADLAEIIFHELSHQRVFAKGDTDFNEAFATAVAEEAVQRWLRSLGNTNALQEYLASQQRTEQFVGLVDQARAQLKAVYGDPAEAKGGTGGLSDNEKREQKKRIIADLKNRYAGLKSQWGGYSGFDAWFARPINNAQLNTIATYYDLVPQFRSLIRASGGDLEKFFETCTRLAKMKDKDGRHNALKSQAGGIS
ncbi:MAG TPA: aminopeptidase [Verrucomicrobiae bacterium]|nr:aminopeptidase [Verrucomicrobiae bacterium]